MIDYQGKNIIVLGLAKSGTTIAKILHSFGANVIVNDKKDQEKCTEKEELERIGIKVICGYHPLDIINKEVDLVIKNPGIPYSIEPIKKAEALKIPVITEVELAYKFSKAPFIGVTGSNGKTTTTTLIGEILQEAGKSPIVAGNIGTVLSEQALIINENQVLVSELSSFQLKGTKVFKPYIAILLNIYPAHLDYHKTIEDYIQSKFNIFRNQASNDFAIINANCEKCMELTSTIVSSIYYFSIKGPVSRGAYIEDEKLYWVTEKGRTELVDTNELFLKGALLENALASIIASHLYDVDFETIIRVLKSFRGVEHRLEYVLTTASEVTFYNDSKATNPQATITALSSFKKPVILIAGGLDRGIDFEELLEPFKKHVKTLITYGQSAEKLNKIAKMAGIEQAITVDNVINAVKQAYEQAKDKDIVLLSPACASWDMYSSFEERGRIFKEAVHTLK